MNAPGLVAQPPHVLEYAPGASLPRALLDGLFQHPVSDSRVAIVSKGINDG